MHHFYRCSHCKELEPTWQALADELKGKVNVAKARGYTNLLLAPDLTMRV